MLSKYHVLTSTLLEYIHTSHVKDSIDTLGMKLFYKSN